MAHLIQSLASTAKSVITLPLHVVKAVAAPVLRQVGVHEAEQAPVRPTGRVDPPPPPVRRTAEEAVARERATVSTPPDTTVDEERYDEFDEPAEPSGNAAPVDGAGSDSGALKQESEPLLDPSTAKAVRSEAETMRKAADRGT